MRKMLSGRLAGLAAGVLILASLGLSACGEGDRAVNPITAPASLARLGKPTNPPLYPPSDDRYILETATPLTAAQKALLLNDFGLQVVTSTPWGSNTMSLLKGAPSVDLAAVNQALGGIVLSSSVNSATDLEDATLIGGFAVGEWSTQSLEGPTGLESLEAESVHDIARGEGVLVAVLDTGVDVDHPMLAANIEGLPSGYSQLATELADGEDDDNDGLIDEAFGHGTHVAGIVLQLAPDARILSIRVLNADGIGSLYDIVRGIQTARELGASVVNLSLSMPASSAFMDSVLEDLFIDRVVVVAAAGNSPWAPTYPGTSPYTVGVAAVDPTGYLASFSGAGSQILLASPGVDVLSTFPGSGTDSTSARASGTSMATPGVSASVALIAEYFGIAPFDAVALLLGYDLPVLPAGSVAEGRVDAATPINLTR